MLKLITVNIEMSKHDDRVLTLLDKEKPDVICLQEAPEEFSHELQERGYQTTFAPMFIRDVHNKKAPVGIILATNLPHTCQTNYYHKRTPTVVEFDKNNQEGTASFAYIMATIILPDNTFNIATTHVMVTKDGLKDSFQTKGIDSLLAMLSKEEPHIICGDFNIPRGHNSLYDVLIEKYQDAIPPKYKSSLDRSLHRLGDKQVEQPIFDEYMVDYIFTQPSYQTKEVRLEFGVSDHAAVIGRICV